MRITCSFKHQTFQDDDSDATSGEEEDATPHDKIQKDGSVLVFIVRSLVIQVAESTELTLRSFLSQADGSKKKGKGSAYIFPHGTERHPRYVLPPSAVASLAATKMQERRDQRHSVMELLEVAFEWGDLDEETA